MPRPAAAVLTAALLTAPALLAAQARGAESGAPARRATGAAPNDSTPNGAAPPPAGTGVPAARPGTARRAPAGAAPAIKGIEPGRLMLDARTRLGISGTLSLGAGGEILVTERGRVGPGAIGVGAAADIYRYGERYGTLGDWSVTVVPVGAYANYHFPLADRRFDPYVGLGLGYAVVSARARVAGGGAGASGRASEPFTFGHLGARYFVGPRFAVQAQTGWGLGGLSVGVSWKR
jgi:hypothetical protein